MTGACHRILNDAFAFGSSTSNYLFSTVTGNAFSLIPCTLGSEDRLVDARFAASETVQVLLAVIKQSFKLFDFLIARFNLILQPFLMVAHLFFIHSTVYCYELPVHRFFSVHILHLNLCLPVSVQTNQNTVLSLPGFCNQGIDDKTAEVPHRYDIAGFHYKRWLGNNRMIHLHFAFLHTALGF